MKFTDSTPAEINSFVENAYQAFLQYRKTSLKQRADLLRSIAKQLTENASALIATAMQESHLPEARLQNELTRTCFQLTSYAAACERGDWLEVSIDKDFTEPAVKPSIKKTKIALGPVVVFGSSNFPFAYSTAGGDTASALAAGCTVIVKAHPAHPQTSLIAANCIQKAIAASQLPTSIFTHIYGASFEVGKQLVQHPLVKAVGFTGSYTGGKQLFDWGNQRKEPIPVFAEMGSVNPVFLLSEKLQNSFAEIATQYAASITLGVGQFCTNPGLIIGIESPALQSFIHDLGKAIKHIHPAKMLHAGIASAYQEKKSDAIMEEDVHLVAESDKAPTELEGQPTIAMVSGAIFLANKKLHQEIFGPYSLVISCKDATEMLAIATSLEGQLTTTVMATENDVNEFQLVIEQLQLKCGRFVFNGVPTGVEVCQSMQHGGPFPASTDGRFGSVGADALKRFARPISYQNWPDHLLQMELQDANPLGINRTINNELTNRAI
jgi:NADP-dependent aldehyde dehydrogenase